MKPNKFICYMFFFNIFGLDRAQTTINFETRWSNWPIETFLLKYLAVVLQHYCYQL